MPSSDDGKSSKTPLSVSLRSLSSDLSHQIAMATRSHSSTFLRVRSIRTWMVAILILGVAFYGLELLRRRAEFLSRMTYHRSEVQSWESMLEFWTDGVELRIRIDAALGRAPDVHESGALEHLKSCARKAEKRIIYHRSLYNKYRSAAMAPWMVVSADPPFF
jgi:hypothetical protein